MVSSPNNYVRRDQKDKGALALKFIRRLVLLSAAKQLMYYSLKKARAPSDSGSSPE
jgi:hypothetical protein